MCRSIQPLFNLEPPSTEAEIHAAALQFVRKISGFRQPSKVNDAAFQAAVDTITEASRQLLSALETNAPPKDRNVLALKAKARAAARSQHSTAPKDVDAG